MKSSAEGMGAIALIADMLNEREGEGRRGGWTVEDKRRGGGELGKVVFFERKVESRLSLGVGRGEGRRTNL